MRVFCFDRRFWGFSFLVLLMLLVFRFVLNFVFCRGFWEFFNFFRGCWFYSSGKVAGLANVVVGRVFIVVVTVLFFEVLFSCFWMGLKFFDDFKEWSELRIVGLVLFFYC